MKRKIFSVLLTVVLVLSFSLIPALPAAAKIPTTYCNWYLALGGTGGASAWSTTQAHDDTYSAYIQSGTELSTSYGRVWKPADIALADITAISFWHYLGSSSQFDHSAWPMYLEEGETYSDGTGYFTPYVTLKIYDGNTDHWLISQPFVRDPDGTWAADWEQWQMSDNAAEYPASSGMDPTEALWHDEAFDNDDRGTGGSGAYPTGWEYLSHWQTTYSGYDVIELKVSMGDWAITTNQTAYVDNITVTTSSATTYAIEPRVSISATPYGAIQTAIDAVTTGQTITCASGTYTEDPVIDNELTLSGPNAAISPNTGTRVTEAIINGQISIPGATNNVTIQGFHFEVTPGVASINCPGGFDGDDLNILKNSFTADPASSTVWEAIGVHSNAAIAALVIDDNLVTGVRGIFVNPQTTGSDVTITDNVIDGDSTAPAYTGISVDGVTGTISGNTISYTYDAGINVGSAVGPCNDLTISNNTVTYAGRALWDRAGAINLYSDCIDVDITGNTLSNSYDGITIKDTGAFGAGNAINYNHISGNSRYGIYNYRAEAFSAAQRNWWGRATGPYHATTNPGVASYKGDTVSDNVTYAPWLYLPAATASDTVAEIITLQVPAYANSVVLSAGWNTFSVPIGLDSQYNTWKELITLTNLNYSLAYRFDSAKQTFVGLATTSPYAIAPGEGFYIKMDTAGSIPYCYSTLLSIPSRSLSAGWDFIAGGMSPRSEIDSCASIITAGGTAGYTHMVNPASNTDGSQVYISGASTFTLYAGEGYWVFLPIARTLGLFDLTPVAWVALP